MGLWDKPAPLNEAGISDLEWPEEWDSFENLEVLRDSGRAFKLLGVRVRKVSTKFGENLSIDVAASYPGEGVAFYSGFSAGVAAMAKNAVSRDFPVWVRIEEKAVSRGTTTILTPVSEQDALSLEAGGEDDLPF